MCEAKLLNYCKFLFYGLKFLTRISNLWQHSMSVDNSDICSILSLQIKTFAKVLATLNRFNIITCNYEVI